VIVRLRASPRQRGSTLFMHERYPKVNPPLVCPFRRWKNRRHARRAVHEQP
jgi:hypothetical protein